MDINVGKEMEVFVDNLKELIMESSLSLRKLAKESGVTATQYSRYLKGSIPTVNITVKIAKYFNCSLDYLFGISSVRQNHFTSYNYDIAKFVENYQKLLCENNVTHYKFIKSLGFDESTIRHWKAGSVPRMDIVYLIAKSLNGSIDELIGRN